MGVLDTEMSNKVLSWFYCDVMYVIHQHIQIIEPSLLPLRVKCESDGTFIDEMNPSGVMESVRELLRQMSAAHVKLYLQAHQENRAALSLTRALNTLTNNITTVAKVTR